MANSLPYLDHTGCVTATGLCRKAAQTLPKDGRGCANEPLFTLQAVGCMARVCPLLT